MPPHIIYLISSLQGALPIQERCDLALQAARVGSPANQKLGRMN